VVIRPTSDGTSWARDRDPWSGNGASSDAGRSRSAGPAFDLEASPFAVAWLGCSGPEQDGNRNDHAEGNGDRSDDQAHAATVPPPDHAVPGYLDVTRRHVMDVVTSIPST
jgi:hypothetical protein